MGVGARGWGMGVGVRETGAFMREFGEGWVWGWGCCLTCLMPRKGRGTRLKLLCVNPGGGRMFVAV